ncbi:unnamed protein product [Tuber melanosporum]|uniref:(Perigord truffle) hypothetical protein n=1 Tax=Tuber melanosporum (strain Mel28) TaxID=656061 RepID=D5GLZ6_TUBMM|nr:uncharacterized protein GSTUM_00010335001 [Tuber melanosporum]CAZ85458.1 unnamed protein product [Tuber melanosporum]
MIGQKRFRGRIYEFRGFSACTMLTPNGSQTGGCSGHELCLNGVRGVGKRCPRAHHDTIFLYKASSGL